MHHILGLIEAVELSVDLQYLSFLRLGLRSSLILWSIFVEDSLYVLRLIISILIEVLPQKLFMAFWLLLRSWSKRKLVWLVRMWLLRIPKVRLNRVSCVEIGIRWAFRVLKVSLEIMRAKFWSLRSQWSLLHILIRCHRLTCFVLDRHFLWMSNINNRLLWSAHKPLAVNWQ